jgi:hypothetical protein
MKAVNTCWTKTTVLAVNSAGIGNFQAASIPGNLQNPNNKF